mmetsp:Transcript_21192/g.49744  ORF Transcript_21192/g.49744 Transcript_21192/m.49744 type:complete len:82 (+) Transcript_21192:1027-1272(+)
MNPPFLGLRGRAKGFDNAENNRAAVIPNLFFQEELGIARQDCCLTLLVIKWVVALRNIIMQMRFRPKGRLLTTMPIINSKK